MKRIIVVSAVLLVTFAGMAGNSKKRTTKVAVPSASAGAYVVTPKPVYDVAGKEIGYVNANGRVVVYGQERSDVHVGRDGTLVDGKGKKIGFTPLGADEVVGDPGKKRVLTPGPNGGCVIPGRNPLNQRMLESGESIPVCGKTVEEVMGNIQVMFGTACKAGVEQILYVVKLPDGRYELRRGDTGDGTPTNVRFRPRLVSGETIVGIIHDHPAGNTKGRNALWPSEMDAVAALDHNANMYVHDCRSDEMSVAYLRRKDGTGEHENLWQQVWLVKNGVPTEKLKMPPPGNYCNGSDPYDSAQYEQYAAGKYSKVCDNRAVTKKQTLGAVRTGGGGGYCACAKPQVFGEKVRESRSNRKRGQVKHYGVVGFICAKCGKVNKAMYAKAQALKAKQTGEGVPTFWMDLQLQQLEQIRQMGDMSDEERQRMAETMLRGLQSTAKGME